MNKNPFEVQRKETAIQAIESDRAVQEVQAAMVIAKRFPRDEKIAMDRILQSCTRPTLAENALYAFRRGNQLVTGPSIRLAEAIAQNWGNVQFGIREIEQRDGASIVQAFAWDVQTNTRQIREFQVKHQRKAHGSINQLYDPRDIYELVASQGARRMRACILSVIPGDVQDAAIAQCEITQQNLESAQNDQIKALLTAFSDVGVTRAQIETRIGHHMESIISAEIIQLRKIFRSIKDGMSTVSDWFEQVSGGTSEDQPETTKEPDESLRFDPNKWFEDRIAKATSLQELQEIMEQMVQNNSDTNELVNQWKKKFTHLHTTGQQQSDSQPETTKEPDNESEPATSSEETTKAKTWPQQIDGLMIDARRVLWNGKIHSSGQVCTHEGIWRRRRGVTDELVESLEKTIDQELAERKARLPHQTTKKKHETTTEPNAASEPATSSEEKMKHEKTTEQEQTETDAKAASDTPVDMFSEQWFRAKISAAEKEQDLDEFLDLISSVQLHSEVKEALDHIIAERRAEIRQKDLPL